MWDADALVVGAGPGGIMTALCLARRGRSVILIEKKNRERIGRPVHVSVEEEALFRIPVPPPERPELLPSPLSRELISPDNKYKLSVGNTARVLLDQRLFLMRLAERAEMEGARLMYECSITGPIVENGKVVGVVGSTADGRLLELRAPLCVDASGVHGVLRHNLDPDMGLEREIDPADVANVWQECREVDREAAMDLVRKSRIRPQANVIRAGFMGPFSSFSVFVDLENDTVDVTVGLPHYPKYPTAKELVEQYIESHPWIGDRIGAGGGLVPVRRPLDSLVTDGLACVGDSGCQAVALHGSGMSSAVIAGRMLAEVADDALERGDTSREALWLYNARYMRTRGAVQANAEIYRRFIHTLSAAEMGAIFQSGLITGEGARGSLEGLALELPASALITAGSVLLWRPGLAARLLRLSSGSRAALYHYEQYPDSPAPEALYKWVKRSDKIFRKWKSPKNGG